MEDQNLSSPVDDPASPESYDREATYEVILSKRVEWPAESGFYLFPRDQHHMNGVVCREVAHAIAIAVKV